MIFFDIEVFAYDWAIVFIDVINKKETVIVNDRKKLIEFYEENKDELFIGFNCNHYDVYIFKGLLLGMNIQAINNHIINEKKPGWSYSDAFYEINLNLHDVFTGFHGLKTLEAFMGHSIEETTVDFTIDRKLTDAELKEVIDYCRYDVEQTIEVFIRRQNEFQTKLDLVTEFDLPRRHISRSNAQLSAIALGATRQPRNDEWELDIPKPLRLLKYDYIRRWYLNPVNHDYTKKLETDIMGVPHILAWGGIHGALNNYNQTGQFVLVDVSSYYPSMMIEFDFMSRNISNKQVFIDMYNERFRLQAAGDPRQEVYKLVLNTAYGCMGYEFNHLYDPRMRNNVCVAGQLLLVDLLESFEDVPGLTLIQSNTDGILLKYETDNQLDEIKKITDRWCDRTGLRIGFDYYDHIIQKDVNNYIALGDEDVFVGGYIKDLNELDNDLPIINRALRNYFINGTPPEITIQNENQLIEFQTVVKVSNLYDYAIHNGQRLPEKTLRVFASTDTSDGEVLKYRKVDGKEQTARFANTSINTFIDNGHIKDKLVPDNLNIDWYIDLAWRRIRQFEGVE